MQDFKQLSVLYIEFIRVSEDCRFPSSFSCITLICVAYLKLDLQTSASFHFRSELLIPVFLKYTCTIFNLFNLYDVVIT